ncbi:MAG: phosphatidylserine/phosphatidylglycerophosphate/cardiolipin synthase family protein [Verrucomicrobiales bacterium]|nr:phosphatidylserine/phosphatidylglycerophosphate/cardiolipin synthase family protein [Verrucomicrobiales bacterium]
MNPPRTVCWHEAGFPWLRKAGVAVARALGLLVLAGASACSLPKPRMLDHAAIVKSGDNLTARQWRNTLAVRFHLPGRNPIALAAWPESDSPQATRLHPAEPNRADFAQAWKHGRRVTLKDALTWRQVVRSLAARLVPVQPGTAVLLSLPAQEILAVRNPGGSVRLMPFAHRPRGLNISRTYSDAELGGMLLSECEQSFGLGSAPVLIATGAEPPLVYFSAASRQVVFLHEPPTEVFGLPLPLLGLEKMSPRFALRTAKSLVWSSNFLSILNNPFSFVVHGIAVTLSMAETFLHWRLLQPSEIQPVPPVVPRPGMDLAAFEAEIAKITGTPAVASSVQFQIDGLEFFQSLMPAMQDAQRAIDLQVFIFDNDDYAVGIADLLRRRSREGIRVRVLMDELGSLMATSSAPDSPMPAGFDPPGNMARHLKENSSVAVREIANPFLVSNHVKLITVDGRRAWFGGMNIGREYRYDWHDLMVEVRGPLVARLQRDFSQTWAGAGWGGDLAVLRARLFPPRDLTRKEPLPPDAIRVQPLYTRTLDHEIESAQILAIRRAQRRIWIQNAYFTDDLMLSELISARRRGVDVRIILPLHNDSGIMGASNLVTIGDFLRNGIRVFGYPRMSHIKAALYDGWACLGTANFDRLSLRLNREFNIGFSDPAKVRELENRLFLKDFSVSREIKTPPPVPWSAYLAEALANQL